MKTKTRDRRLQKAPRCTPFPSEETMWPHPLLNQRPDAHTQTLAALLGDSRGVTHYAQSPAGQRLTAFLYVVAAIPIFIFSLVLLLMVMHNSHRLAAATGLSILLLLLLGLAALFYKKVVWRAPRAGRRSKDPPPQGVHVGDEFLLIVTEGGWSYIPRASVRSHGTLVARPPHHLHGGYTSLPALTVLDERGAPVTLALNLPLTTPRFEFTELCHAWEIPEHAETPPPVTIELTRAVIPCPPLDVRTLK